MCPFNDACGFYSFNDVTGIPVLDDVSLAHGLGFRVDIGGPPASSRIC